MDGESLWLSTWGCCSSSGRASKRLHAVLAYEFERFTTHVRLVGAGADVLGEDVSVIREDGPRSHDLGRRCRSRASGRWPASAPPHQARAVAGAAGVERRAAPATGSLSRQR